MTTVELVRDATPYGDEIRRLLEVANKEFVPPLSGREGTTQESGLDETQNNALDEYYDQCINQTFILTRTGNEVHGFLSFRQGYRTDAIGTYEPSNYASTLIVDPDHRRQGYARKMYQTLLGDLPSDLYEPYVTTRTWSTNDSHITLLDELGFELITRIEDDRGAGIDTVYYGISVDEHMSNS